MRSFSRRRVAVVASLALLCVVGCSIAHPWRGLTTNDITTGATANYPEIQPRKYAVAPDRAFEAARQACADVPRTTIVKEDAAARRIEAERRTRTMRFVDDVSIWIEPEGEGCRVMLRSHSRIGKGDFGQNSRTIRALQEAMDRRVGEAR